jgi:hypothetical protein
MSNIGLKLKLKTNLKKQIEDESTRSGGTDNRFLNYWDLKDSEKVKILFVPDTNGELWGKFKKHGPSLKLRGSGSVRCAYESSGDTCPACQHGFGLLDLAKETEDKAYKDEAKRWFARDYTLMSCIVLDSPFEVNEHTDHNQVKLIYVPFSVEKTIKESITEGQLDEDELCRTPFFIKKTKNAGGYADYSTSYFNRKQVEDDELSFFDDLVVEQFDYSDIDVIPPASNDAEVQEWFDKAYELDQKGDSKGGDKEPEKAPEPRKTVNASRPVKTTPEPKTEIDEEEGSMGETPREDEPPADAPKKSSPLRERLNSLK